MNTLLSLINIEKLVNIKIKRTESLRKLAESKMIKRKESKACRKNKTCLNLKLNCFKNTYLRHKQ